MATHFRILAWRIPRTEEPGGLQSMGSQRVRHDLVTKQQHMWSVEMLVFFLGSSNTLKYFPRIDLKACAFPSGPGHLLRQKVQGPGERGTGANCTCKTGSEPSPASTGPGQCLGGRCMPLCSETCRVPSCYHNGDSQEVGWGRGCPASWHMALPSSTLGAGDSPSRGFSLPEFLVGNLVVTQNTSLPWPSSYLTKTVLKVSFLLHDPSNFFKNASFLYSWDFGDGYVLSPFDAPESWPVWSALYSAIFTCSLSLQTCLAHLLYAKLGVPGDQCEPV